MGLGAAVQQAEAGRLHPAGPAAPSAPTAAQRQPQHQPGHTQGECETTCAFRVRAPSSGHSQNFREKRTCLEEMPAMVTGRVWGGGDGRTLSVMVQKKIVFSFSAQQMYVLSRF